MTLLASHLGQISLSTKSIAELEFPPPKIFTNALLKDHEITTLIRDTEPHERALFTLDPTAISRPRQQDATQPNGSLQTRKSLFPNAHPVRQSAVTRLLGRDMLQEIRQSSNKRDGVNVEVLLRGAEKLCDVYAVAGVPEKIRALRNRYQEVAASLSSLEEKVSKQQSQLDRRNKSFEFDDEAENDLRNTDGDNTVMLTEQDFQNEENEIRELEAKKKALEERVSGMERDLGGLLR
ncbi:hypothetical protein PV05_01746 [Exophiala xenobiotica]|uniref:DASH complex subunit SPC34 n=1 Tax=Exophiala xenobiotica TaxID=348802 RepID=A0A0D2DH76_9EURO|nr:uncharacterized protein PV05_01746 [Exophiala xenobiotica]KIW61647.1 hypothetical protein PV05_01746 [Exophiala xenobiotica]